MATQWTAGLSAGNVLPASTLNTIGAAWVDYTPTLVQGVAVTKTINTARYCQFQKTVIVSVKMTVTGAGTGGQFVIVGLPLSARAANAAPVGTMSVYDTNTNLWYNLGPQLSSVNDCYGFYQTGFAFGVSPAITLAAGDQVFMSFTYEVA
jgi:hypothetical protein